MRGLQAIIACCPRPNQVPNFLPAIQTLEDTRGGILTPRPQRRPPGAYGRMPFGASGFCSAVSALGICYLRFLNHRFLSQTQNRGTTRCTSHPRRGNILDMAEKHCRFD